MKHTKGPWALVFEKLHENFASSFVLRGPDNYIVTELKMNNPKALGDSHLIAAAPEMLEALELIEKTLLEKHQGIENHTFELGLLSEILEKAKGES